MPTELYDALQELEHVRRGLNSRDDEILQLREELHVRQETRIRILEHQLAQLRPPLESQLPLTTSVLPPSPEERLQAVETELLESQCDRLELRFECEQHRVTHERLRKRVQQLEAYVDRLETSVRKSNLHMDETPQRDHPSLSASPHASSALVPAEVATAMEAVKRIAEQLRAENEGLRKSNQLLARERERERERREMRKKEKEQVSSDVPSSSRPPSAPFLLFV